MEERPDIQELQRESDRLGEQIEQAREDWEEKKEDEGVPGAIGDVAAMDADDAPETDYPAKG